MLLKRIFKNMLCMILDEKLKNDLKVKRFNI